MIEIDINHDRYDLINNILYDIWLNDATPAYADDFALMCRDEFGMKGVVNKSDLVHVNRWLYQFENEEAVTLFLLRWA